MTAPTYTKHFIPLESNPRIFTQLIHSLGASPALHFEDVLSLNEPSLLPHPALALILTFPTLADYEQRRVAESALQKPRAEGQGDEHVVWFKQTINNACGFYAILHAIVNGEGRRYIQSGSILSALLDACATMNDEECARYLEDSEEIAAVYDKAALQGESEVSEDPEDEVDFHFVCFVKDGAGTGIWELDGDKVGPVKRGEVGSGEDLLGEMGKMVIKESIGRESGVASSVAFSLMALTVDYETPFSAEDN